MSQKPVENKVSEIKREISDESGNLKSNLEVENPNKDDEYVNLSFVKSVKKEGEQAEQNIQQAANDIQDKLENKHQEVHQEVLEIKAEAVHKVEEVQAEASGNIDQLKTDAGANVDQIKGKVSEVKSNIESDISKKKDHIEEELSERKAVLTQEAAKIEEDIKDNQNQFNSKVGAVADSANILKTAAADTARGLTKPITTHNQKDDNVDEEYLALYAHNYVRKLHGVAPMKWDDHLAEQSQKWAVHLAENDSGLQHSEPLDGFGENLYISKGSTAATGAHQAVLQWYKTITHYNFNVPKFNLSSGTFTQLVWDDTLKLGVGVAFREDTRNTYIVAQYAPPGNGRYSESFKQHVKKPLAGCPARIPKLEELVPPSNNEEDQPSKMKSLFDVLCGWCATKENKPVESWSGVQSSNEENTVEAKATPLKSSQGTIDGNDDINAIKRKPDNNEATK